MLAEFSSSGGPGGRLQSRTLAAAHLPMPPQLAAILRQLCGHDYGRPEAVSELEAEALAAAALAHLYARCVRQLLAQAGVREVAAIGAHGQTVRHYPRGPACPAAAELGARLAAEAAAGEAEDRGAPSGTTPTVQPPRAIGFTRQLLDASLLAELCRCGPVVADLRSRDVAAGGEGAPLVPAFHRATFASASPESASMMMAVVNLGGIANLSAWIEGREADPPIGWDVGPGNVLLDAWAARHLGAAYDADGAWAAGGKVSDELLHLMESDVYFAQEPPKSTGRETFKEAWLEKVLARLALSGASKLEPRDVQATLVRLTAATAARDITLAHNMLQRRQGDTGTAAPAGWTVVLCGGGARNSFLREALAAQIRAAAAGMPQPPRFTRVATSDEFGVPAEHVEALAFAYLAQQRMLLRPGNVSAVTGAAGPRVLGAIYAG